MADKLKLSIQAAVTSGFARCSESDAPLCCLADYLEKICELGWGSEDVRSVETDVLELLRRAKENDLSRQRDSDAA